MTPTDNTIQQWEYKVEVNHSGFGLTDLNEFGLQGWELCSAYKDLGHYFYYFKRPIINTNEH